MKILFTEPVFQERIWGGRALESFGYELPPGNIGECWAVSAHPNGMCMVNTDEGKISLKDLWENHKDFFGNPKEKDFPLLVKILDAKEDLSVQVHPNKFHEKEPPKNECWYVLDCRKDAYVIYGHRVKTREDLKQSAKNNTWQKILIKKPIKPGDIIYVPSGTIHAICKNTLIWEVQQSSDITYRLYDYNRTDSCGLPRELHLEKGLESAFVPHEDAPVEIIETKTEGGLITRYKFNAPFTLFKYSVTHSLKVEFPGDYLIVGVIKGEGFINRQKIVKGQHFILPRGFGDFKIEGSLELLAAKNEGAEDTCSRQNLKPAGLMSEKQIF